MSNDVINHKKLSQNNAAPIILRQTYRPHFNKSKDKTNARKPAKLTFTFIKDITV